jgi:uncharacterized RDD family membrane protein YckC
MSLQHNPYTPATSFLGSDYIAGEPASAGRRFWTFAVDFLALRAIFFACEVGYVVVFGPEAYDAVANSAWWYAAFAFLYITYYVALEFIFGRTFGKVLLGTRVVSVSDAAPSLFAVLVRTLSRLIPLEPASFSLADTWWHDSLSKTKVLYIRRAS